jgi:hypothetical protein
MKVRPEVSKETASKVVGKMDKRIKTRYPEQYAGAVAKLNVKVDIEAEQYKAMLVKNCGNKSAAVRELKPELAPQSAMPTAARIEHKLDASDPGWRQKLANAFDPNKYFEKINDIATSTSFLVPANVKRQACLDMLAFQNFTKESTEDESERGQRRGKYRGHIDKVLNIQVQPGATLNITGSGEKHEAV